MCITGTAGEDESCRNQILIDIVSVTPFNHPGLRWTVEGVGLGLYGKAMQDGWTYPTIVGGRRNKRTLADEAETKVSSRFRR